MKPGDTVSVTFHPMKDGTRGGQFIQATLPGGKQVIRANARDENEVALNSRPLSNVVIVGRARSSHCVIPGPANGSGLCRAR